MIIEPVSVVVRSGISVIGAFVVVSSSVEGAVVGKIVVVDAVVEALLTSMADIICKHKYQQIFTYNIVNRIISCQSTHLVCVLFD